MKAALYAVVITASLFALSANNLQAQFNKTNLKVWLKAETMSSTLSDGNAVTQWTDISGNSNHAQQPYGFTPVYKSQGICNAPAIYFDGDRDYLILPSPQTIGISNNDYEIFIVAQSSSSASQFLLSGDVNNYELQLNSEAGTGFRFIPSSSLSIDQGSAGSYTNNFPHIISVRGGASGGFIRLDKADGTSSGSDARNANGSLTLLELGGRANGTGWFNGYISEVLIFNTILSESDRNAVERYLFSNWDDLGSAGFSGTEASYTSIAIDRNGTPYVVYKDNYNIRQTCVKKFNGSEWVSVGSTGISQGMASYQSIAINESGTPYIVYYDHYSGGAAAKKFNGADWENVGNIKFSPDVAYYLTIAIDGSGTPYAAYQDFANNNKATVMKYNGSEWVIVGTAGFSANLAAYLSLAIDGSGVPYLAYRDNGNGAKATVKRFNGTSWENVGSAGFSAGEAQYTSMVLDGSGNPYVAFKDAANSGKATVMRYNGASWENVGTPGFSAGAAEYVSLALTGSGTPYVLYSDGGNSDKATVMRYNGSSWINVGAAGFSGGRADYTSIAADQKGSMYVVYKDYSNSYHATVKKFSITPPTVQSGDIEFSAVYSAGMTISWSNGNGVRRAVFVKQANSGTAVPVNNTTYSADPVFRSGTQIGSTGWYCVYNGTGSSVSINGLTAETDYIVQVFEYEGVEGNELYLTSATASNPKVQQTTAMAPITVQAHSIVFTGVSTSQMTLSWTNGNGEKRAVFVKEADSGSAVPQDNTTYNANSAFRSGTQIGSTGWYCVYNGTGTSVTVSGLSPATNYIVQVFEYNGPAGSESYFTLAASDNPKMQRTTIVFIPAAPVNLTGYRGQIGSEYEFTLTGSSATSGIWGSGPYTDDSPCAIAAVHAGYIAAGEKKIVKFTIAAGSSSYTGSKQNDVTSSAYSSPWPGSYYVTSSRSLETPITQSASVSFTNVSGERMQINWTRGNGEYAIVFVKQGNSGTVSPVDYVTYTANTSFGSGSQAGGSGWFCVYKGTGTSVTVTNLNATTDYIAQVFEYNYDAAYERYCSAAGAGNPQSQATTIPTAPTIQTSNVAYSHSGSRELVINWTNGNGSRRAAFIKQATSGTASPSDNITYTANTSVGSGSQIGSTGWYCIYNGTGTSVTVNGFYSATPYIIQVFEYNGGAGSEKYLTASASNNPKQCTTAVKSTLSPPPDNLYSRRGIIDSYYELALTGTTTGGKIWGGDPYYTDDSYCPMAAVHYGAVVPNEKKIVVFQMKAGAFSFPQTTKNGITSEAYGVFEGSYIVTGQTYALEVPTIQASNVLFSNIQETQMNINWTRGNGDYCLVFVKQSNSGTATPANYESYTANSSFADGEQIGSSGWYCVYNGTGNSVTVTNLSQANQYTAHVVEYNYGATYETYNSGTASNNPNNESPLPVELTAFTAENTGTGVGLKWTTVTEVNNYGFEVERKSLSSHLASPSSGSHLLSSDWEKIGFVEGAGNSNSPKEYMFTDDLANLFNACKMHYRLKQIDNDGGYSFSPEIELEVKIIPSEFVLFNNYPNPANPSTTIRFGLPAACAVQLEVYNTLGERAAQLVNEIKEAGYYEVRWNAADQSSGIYFYTMSAKGESGGKEFRTVKKMLIIK